MRAMWNGTVLAGSDQTVVVEGRHWHGVRVERSGAPPSWRGERIGFLRRLLGGAETGAERS